MKDMSHNIILGRTFFDLTNANIDFASKTLTLSKPIQARTTQPVILPPNSESILSLMTDGDVSDGTEVIVKPLYDNGEGTMWTAHTLSTVTDNYLYKSYYLYSYSINQPTGLNRYTQVPAQDILKDDWPVNL